jgi:late competence protein required for DNA uptake (superfamily II DNA/RNA helicase)
MTGDPLADFDRHDAEQQRKLEELPCCERCGYHIQQEKAVCIDGDYYCDDCLDEMRKPIGDD